ncbi:hypothetical protein C8035_v006042 [Colletotrichum spinosum]|uniref:ToxB-like N-terminal ascomycota domain-containing protein n=1 Tax=Colletotrichum spinosum TaxID=1347390 RepID=A0A4R8Q3M4_9PEZI|nr:hypothetical protein C8035_v006042 [Colletotrichum spinosum]
MKFTLAACLLGSYAGLAAAATGCQVELLNINQAVVGSGCVPFNYYANIYDSITRAGYTVEANINCGRTETNPTYSTENVDYTVPPQSPPRRTQNQEHGREWEDSIYGMYGDVKTPRDPPPRPSQQHRRQKHRAREPEEDEESVDEEVPRRPGPEPQRPRYSRPRTNPSADQYQRQNTPRENRRSERHSGREGRDRREQQGGQDQQSSDRNYRRVHINIDTGADGGRSWSWSTDDGRGPNVNFGTPFGGSGPSLFDFGAPFGESGFPFGGRGDNGGRLPVNVPFGGLPVNLPFGL